MATEVPALDELEVLPGFVKDSGGIFRVVPRVTALVDPFFWIATGRVLSELAREPEGSELYALVELSPSRDWA